MPQISHIHYHDVLQAHRFDADFFKPEYLAIERNLEKLNAQPLNNYCVYVKKGIFDISPTKYVSTGIPFLRVSNTKSFFINSTDLVFLDEQTHKENNKTELKKGDIILSKVGTIGDAVINLDYEKVNFSQNNVGIKIRHDMINSAYVIAFFNSKYGRKQIEKQQSGQVQSKIVLDDIKFLKVPRLSNENKIGGMILESNEKKNKSKSLYHEAEQLLLAELGLLDHQIIHQIAFSTTKSAVNRATRYDAEYFQPKYDQIMQKIESYETVNLGQSDFFSIVTGAYAQEYSDDGGKYYIRSVNIQDSLKVSLDDMYTTKLDLGNKFIVKKGDIITSRVGSIGSLGYINKDLNNSYISDNILRIRNTHKKLDNLFLAFYLKQIGTIFMERLQRGSVQQRLNQETLKEIKIPLIDQSIQSKIVDLITQSHQLSNESKQLLDDAKRMVEEEIEKQ